MGRMNQMIRKKICLDYEPGKIVVTGVTGHNGFLTLEMLSHLEQIRELVGLVRKPEDIERVEARLRQYEETTTVHSQVKPVITTDVSRTSNAQVWVNWKGVNLATLQKQNANLEQEARNKGMHLRDLLLDVNLEIAIEDAKLAHSYAPFCMYLQQGNPCDVLAHLVTRVGLEPQKVVSTGALMEFYRWTKLYSIYFGDLTMERCTGFYIGEHGELAIPARIFIGGVTPEEYALARHGPAGLKVLDKIYDDVTNEAHWLRERLGDTPSEGPSAVTRDLVRMILNPSKSTILSISCDSQGNYGLSDIHISIPAAVGLDGAKPIPITFDSTVMHGLFQAADHIYRMNEYGEKLYKEKYGGDANGRI